MSVTRKQAPIYEDSMYFRALAADYDGTLAHHGAVEADTVVALKLLKDTGRKLLLVTGREIADLRRAFPELELFDRVVAENGGVIYDPVSGRESAIAPAPPAAFVQKLMERNVEPISVGRTIVATWLPHDTAVLSAIEELGLELHIIFNKGAVMVLPSGVNKATGLDVALEELSLSPLNVVAVGDAENDHTFLKASGCSAAVANALPAIKEACDIELSRDHGAGVAELIERIVREDAQLLPAARGGILTSTDRNGDNIYLRPQESMLIAGGSGSGKSRFVTLLAERMIDQQQEFCIIDPEGDYETLDGALAVGNDQTPPSVEETIRLLTRRDLSVVVSTIALDLEARRRFFARLLPALLDLRARTGRPHWLILDEAHHFMPRIDGEVAKALSRDMSGTVLVTLDPKWIPIELLRRFDVLFAFGSAAPAVVAEFAHEAGLKTPDVPSRAPDEALLWSRSAPETCRAVVVGAPKQSHARHKGKYAFGDVGKEQSFYFACENGHSFRRARNLAEFINHAREAHDSVWEKHLHAGDFAAWFLGVIRDEDLAHRATEAAEDPRLKSHQSRRRIIDAIRERYVIPDQVDGH
jgi:HAD superfamily hydrolase (TIGR01484 family)